MKQREVIEKFNIGDTLSGIGAFALVRFALDPMLRKPAPASGSGGRFG